MIIFVLDKYNFLKEFRMVRVKVVGYNQAVFFSVRYWRLVAGACGGESDVWYVSGLWGA